MMLRLAASLAPVLVSVGLSVGASACSGSADGQLPTADPATSSGGAAAPGGSESGGTTGGSTTGAPAPSGGSTTSDAGTAEGGNGTGNGTGGGTGGGNGTKCPAGAAVEAEDNDTEAKANAIPAATGSFCGALSTAADVDYVTFTLPADAKSLAFGSSYSKVGVDFEVTVEGKTFLVGETPEVKPGKTYVIKAFTTGSAPVDYRLSVTIAK
jgi:hypothetical protein